MTAIRVWRIRLYSEVVIWVWIIRLFWRWHVVLFAIPELDLLFWLCLLAALLKPGRTAVDVWRDQQ